MALQSSGPISLGDIQGEFGGSNPISISEYYGADTGVPASGTISLSDFYGTSAAVTVTFDLASYAVVDVVNSSTELLANATFAVQNNGVVSGSNMTDGEWTPDAKAAGNGDPYEVRITGFTGDALSSGPAVNTWTALTSDVVWILSQFNVGNKTCSFTVEIREAGGSTLDTAGVNMDVAVI